MAAYTRQSVFNNGDPNDATQINAEFDQIVLSLDEAFDEEFGHAHDGTVGGGPRIPAITIDDDPAAVTVTPGTVTTTGTVIVDDFQGTGTLTGNLEGDSDGVHTGAVTSYVEGTNVSYDNTSLDFDDSNVHVRDLTADIILTLDNVPAFGSSKLEMILKTNGYLVTWPAGLVYEGTGLAPELGSIDRLIFSKYEGDSSIYLMHTPMVA